MTNYQQFRDYRAKVTFTADAASRVWVTSVCSPSRDAAIAAAKYHFWKKHPRARRIHRVVITETIGA